MHSKPVLRENPVAGRVDAGCFQYYGIEDRLRPITPKRISSYHSKCLTSLLTRVFSSLIGLTVLVTGCHHSPLSLGQFRHPQSIGSRLCWRYWSLTPFVRNRSQCCRWMFISLTSPPAPVPLFSRFQQRYFCHGRSSYGTQRARYIERRRQFFRSWWRIL